MSTELSASAPKPRVVWVDSARCIAMFFIMWLHVGQAPEWIGHPVGGGICLFFVLAGYFMAREPRKALGRTLRLGLAWLLWSLLTLGLYVAVQPGMQWTWERAIGWNCAAYNTPLWFLRNLTLYQLVIILLASIRILPRAQWPVLIVLAALSYVREPAQHEGLRFDWMMAVMLGYCLRSISLQRIEEWLTQHLWLVLAVIAVILTQREFYPLYAQWQGLSYYRCSLPVTQLCYATLFFLAAIQTARYLPWLNTRLAQAGSCMMFTYAAHSLLYAVIYHFDLPRWCGFAYAIVGITVLTLLYRFLAKHFPRTIAFLTAK